MNYESEPTPTRSVEKCVSMPHLDKSILNIDTGGEIRTIYRWNLICEELHKLKEILIRRRLSEDINVPLLIETCIRNYSPSLDCTFGILKEAYGEYSSKELEEEDSFESILIFVIECALCLPQLFPGSIELLNGESCTEVITLSKDKIACLLANAFFCTFPDRENDRMKFLEYPRINFTALFDDKDNLSGPGWKTRHRQSKIEKVKCFLNYFRRMKERFGEEEAQSPHVIFERRSLSPDEIPEWSTITKNFLRLKMHSSGVIEDSIGSLLVEFANKDLGGGTLGNGAAMEEIRFSSCPELVVGQLFTKMFYPLDSLLVHKFEQFSSHSGYGSTFKFSRDFLDASWEQNHVCAMDANHFPKDSGLMQFEKKWIDRELHKCVSAFQKSDILPQEDCSRIASGKWGCGVFNGDPLLKSVIQWMAASYCGKSLDLYTFGDRQLVAEMGALEEFIKGRKCSIGQLYKCLVSYRGYVHRSGPVHLVDFLRDALQNRAGERSYNSELNGGDDDVEISKRKGRPSYYFGGFRELFTTLMILCKNFYEQLLRKMDNGKELLLRSTRSLKNLYKCTESYGSYKRQNVDRPRLDSFQTQNEENNWNFQNLFFTFWKFLQSFMRWASWLTCSIFNLIGSVLSGVTSSFRWFYCQIFYPVLHIFWQLACPVRWLFWIWSFPLRWCCGKMYCFMKRLVLKRYYSAAKLFWDGIEFMKGLVWKKGNDSREDFSCDEDDDD